MDKNTKSVLDRFSENDHGKAECNTPWKTLAEMFCERMDENGFLVGKITYVKIYSKIVDTDGKEELEDLEYVSFEVHEHPPHPRNWKGTLISDETVFSIKSFNDILKNRIQWWM